MQSRLFRSEEHTRALAAVHHGMSLTGYVTQVAKEVNESEDDGARAAAASVSGDKPEEVIHGSDASDDSPTRTEDASLIPLASVAPLNTTVERGKGVHEDLPMRTEAALPTVQKKSLNATVVRHDTLPNGTVIKAGRHTKRWTVKNTGTDPWPANTKLVVMPISTLFNIDVRSINPGEETQIEVKINIPDISGIYKRVWRLRSGHNIFGESLEISVEVASGKYDAGLVQDLNYGLLEGGNPPVVGSGSLEKKWIVTNIGTDDWPTDTRLELTAFSHVQLQYYATIKRYTEPETEATAGKRDVKLGTAATASDGDTKRGLVIKPGDMAVVSVTFTVEPDARGQEYDFKSTWRLRSEAAKSLFGHYLKCNVKVVPYKAADVSDHGNTSPYSTGEVKITFKAKNTGVSPWHSQTTFRELETSSFVFGDRIKSVSQWKPVEPGEETEIVVQLSSGKFPVRCKWRLYADNIAFGPEFMYEFTREGRYSKDDSDAEYVPSRYDPYQDGTEIAAGTVFKKSWMLRNCGTLKWPDGTTLNYVSGSMNSRSYPVKLAAPNQVVQVDVLLKVPLHEGNYDSTWQLMTQDGRAFGDRLECRIKATTPAKESWMLTASADTSGKVSDVAAMSTKAPAAQAAAAEPVTLDKASDEMPYPEVIKMFRRLKSRMMSSEETKPDEHQYLIIGASPGRDTAESRYGNVEADRRAASLRAARELFLEDPHIYTMDAVKQEYVPAERDQVAAAGANVRFIHLNIRCLRVFGVKTDAPFKFMTAFMPMLFDEIMFDWDAYKTVLPSIEKGVMNFLHALLKPGGRLIVPYNVSYDGMKPLVLSEDDICKEREGRETARQYTERLKMEAANKRQLGLYEAMKDAFGTATNGGTSEMRFRTGINRTHTKSTVYNKLNTKNYGRDDDGKKTVTVATKQVDVAWNKDPKAAERRYLLKLVQRKDNIHTARAYLENLQSFGSYFGIDFALMVRFNEIIDTIGKQGMDELAVIGSLFSAEESINVQIDRNMTLSPEAKENLRRLITEYKKI